MLQKLNRVTVDAPTRPIKVLQFGKGNFLRAFTDWMIDILNEKTDFNSGVTIVQSNSTETDDRFHAQGGLYHVVINGIRMGKPFREIRLITSVQEVINPFIDYSSFLKSAENPDLQFIVSNTTEAGIAFNPKDAGPDTSSQTFPGKLTALLYHRYKLFQGDPLKAVTVLPCELIENNGAVLRNMVSQYITHWSLEGGFRRWIHDETLFCNTLVDRIVPGFPKDDAENTWRETGYKDELIVTAEPYHLWVIEPVPHAGFSMEKLRAALPLEKAGLQAKFVGDLAPYRSSKVRILNGAHTCMVPVAWLHGLRTVREAIAHPDIGVFIRDAIHEEIVPTLDLPRRELEQFAADVVERFQNPFIRHELSAIALNSVSKFRVRVLPTILAYHHRHAGKLPERLVRALAAMILFYKGEWKGEATPLKDTPEVMALFREAWSTGRISEVVQKVLSSELLWGMDLLKIPGLPGIVETEMRKLDTA